VCGASVSCWTAVESVGFADPNAGISIEKVTIILRSGFFKNTMLHNLKFTILKFGAKVHYFLTRKSSSEKYFDEFKALKVIYCLMCNKLVLRSLDIVKKEKMGISVNFSAAV
jgi:hypothetical protein